MGDIISKIYFYMHINISFKLSSLLGIILRKRTYHIHDIKSVDKFEIRLMF